MNTSYEPLPEYGATSDHFQMGRRMGALEAQNTILKWIVSLIGIGFASSILWILYNINSNLVHILNKIH